MEKLLIVDDDVNLLNLLKMHFEERSDEVRQGLEVHTAGTVREALRRAAEVHPDAVVLDMMLPDGLAIDALPELQAVVGDAPVIVVTAHFDMETTIRAMKLGAYDYLHKPFRSPAILDEVVMGALAARSLAKSAHAPLETTARLGDIVGNSPRIHQIVKEIGKVAASRATVLIAGESGTGKELIAQVIHHYSDDRPRPFVGINCSSIVDTLLESELFGHEKGAFSGAVATKVGKFEQAEDGTVFLDEIGDMQAGLQAKLLRVLQEREFERVGGLKKLVVRARIIAATHRNLAEEVAAGRFREDLYQRLNVMTIEVPPLRERREDIPSLTRHLLEKINIRVGKKVTIIPGEVMQLLVNRSWFGNIRELENTITRAVVLAPGNMLLKEHVAEPPPGQSPSAYALRLPGTSYPATPVPAPGYLGEGARESRFSTGIYPGVASTAGASGVPNTGEEPFLSLDEVERRHILKALEHTRGHKGRACDLLGISRPTLERKLRRYRGEPEE